MHVKSDKNEFLELLDDFQPGTILKETFKVNSFIESGGMGYILKGFHLNLKKDIAIKILKDSRTEMPSTLNYFLNEGRKMALVNHPFVVKVYDVGLHKGRHYLVMDYIEGRDLHTFIEESQPFGFQSALKVMIKLSNALSAIHQAEMIHRDIKPSNIMISNDMNPVILDFGIAKIKKNRDCFESKDGLADYMTGTPGFIAPELVQNCKAITKAADIYSLGKTFYFLLTGEPLVKDAITQKLIEKLRTQNAPIPKSPLKLFPRSFNKILTKMLKPEPEDRYQDADSVCKDLKRIEKTPKNSLIIAGGIIGILFVVILALFFSRDSPPPEWSPKPRVFAVIPFVGNQKSDNYIPFEFIKYIRTRYPYYKVVDDAHVEKIINELQLIKDGWISPENSAKIGELVGAQIFIMFDKTPYKGKELIYPNAYEVQTRLILGSSRLDPDLIDLINSEPKNDLLDNVDNKSTVSEMQMIKDQANAKMNNAQFLASEIDQLMAEVAKSLEYISFVKSIINEHEVLLEHGRLYGAESGMRMCVLNNRNEVIALLEVKDVHHDYPSARIIEGGKNIRTSMRVRELKDDTQS